MPSYKVHLVGGACTLMLLLAAPIYVVNYKYQLDMLTLCWLFFCSFAGALFPDIDIKSKGQLLFSKFALCVVIVVILTKKWAMLSGIALALLVPLVVHHRGLTHQLWFVLLIPLFIPLAAVYASKKLVMPAFLGYLFFVAGAVSHLVLDFGIRNFLKRGLFGWPKRGKR